MARDMYGPMTGASMWMMTREWDARHLFLLWAMWAVMMAGMMVPSAAPFILLYGAAARRRVAGRRATREIYALAAGYLAMWSLFSVAATAGQRLLSMLLILSPKGGFNAAGLGWQLLILLGCLAWSLGTIYHRNAAAVNPPLMFVALQMLAGGLGLLAVAAVAREPFAFEWTPRAFAAFLFLTLASSCLAYSAYAWLTVHATPVVVGSYGYVCPAVAAVMGWLLLDETLSWVQVAGMGVILAGIALVTGYWQPLPPSRRAEGSAKA